MTVLLVAVVSIQAQHTITGNVIDSDEKQPVIQATVSLLKTDSTLVANAVTNVNGVFTVTAKENGNHLLRVTYVGYKTVYKKVVVGDKPVNVGTMTIAPDAVMLKGAEVVKHLAKVTTKDDTIIFNAAAYRTPEGSVVEELVKKLPGAEIGDDGSIKINGKTVQKIKVDGL